MNPTRYSLIVGLFVFVGLGLIAGLILLFQRNINLAPTYTLLLKAPNVGLVIPNATVRMAGVPVGFVDRIELAPDGRSVNLYLEIFRKYAIHTDAQFLIEQVGFLGDQFVAIAPRSNSGRLLKEGDVVEADEPFNLQELARSAVGLIRRVDETVQKLNDAVSRVDQHLFSERTLTNLATTVENFRRVSERAFSAVENFDTVVQTNIPTIGLAMSNLVIFTQELNYVADDVRSIVSTNRDEISQSIQNLRSASEGMNTLITDAQAGRGLAGFLLREEDVKTQASLLLNNLTTLSSNLNKYGLLYKPKRERAPLANPPLYPGRTPF